MSTPEGKRPSTDQGRQRAVAPGRQAAACFDRNGVWVVAHWLGFEVSAPGDGSPVANFPEAEMAIRFVRAFEQDADLMAANQLNDAQFERAQFLVGQVFEEVEQELKDTLKRLREWQGLDDEDGTGLEVQGRHEQQEHPAEAELPNAAGLAGAAVQAGQ